MPGPDVLHVALADDHDLMRAGIADLLHRSERYRVTVHARNGQELVQALEAGAQVSIAIVDLSMPVMDGYAVADWLKQHRPLVRVLVYSQFADDAAVIRSYRGGAHGFLCKEEAAEQLVVAMDTLAAGAVYHTDYSQRVLLENPDGLTVEERRRARLLAQIPQSHWGVLEAICRGDDLTYAAMARELKLNRRTVERYASELCDIFGVRTKTALAVSAIQLGLAKPSKGS